MINRIASSAPQQSRIREICKQHNISSLMHFTRLENLPGIMVHGIISRLELNRREIPMVINDVSRFDQHLDAVCLSISFPNYQMFYRYRSNSNDVWVILEIDAQVLDLDCAFCPTNAASSTVKNMPINQRKGSDALERLFDDYTDPKIKVPRNSLNIPCHYPTNPQAEVLAFERIPQNFIRAVYVEKRKQLSDVGHALPLDKRKLLSVNAFFFGARQDYIVWKAAKETVNRRNE